MDKVRLAYIQVEEYKAVCVCMYVCTYNYIISVLVQLNPNVCIYVYGCFLAGGREGEGEGRVLGCS